LDPTDYTSPDPDIGVGSPPDNTNPGNNIGIGHISDGTYTVINLQVVVGSTPDNNYDLVVYENNNNGVVYMDWIIIGISMYADGHEYYEVFNWGNNGVLEPDTNSNVGDVAQSTGTEADNQHINLNELYDPDGAGVGSAPQTGILIDVDNATSNPPPDTYTHVVIISPIGGGSGQVAEVDAVQAVEVPIP
jgi:hypothetical protein